MNAPTRRAVAIVALGIFGASLYLLLTASPWLLLTAVEAIGLPLGNVIAWAMIAALPVATYLGFYTRLNRDTASSRVLRAVTSALLVLGLAWGVVCYGLAGNWAYNFSGRADGFQGSELAALIFWAYTLGVVAVTVLLALVLLIGSASRRLPGR